MSGGGEDSSNECGAKIAKLEQSKPLAFVLGTLMLVLISLTAYRVYSNYSFPSHEFDWTNRGHSDFHNGVYYPAMAFRERVNPYAKNIMEKYPVAAPSRTYPPITFIVHLPFTLMELKTADAAFFVYNTLLLLWLAYFAVKLTRGNFNFVWWMFASCLLLASRPGHITLFTGYFTLELVLGTVIAIANARQRPWLSAIGILLASGKPTYVLPLLLLMTARKNYRAVFLGIVFCVIAGVGGLVWLASDSSLSGVATGIMEGQAEFHADEAEFPINTWTRVDLLGMVAKVINWNPDDKVYLVTMLVLLAIPCLAIRQMVDREIERHEQVGLSGYIILISILLAIYHQSYDCLLVAIPCVGVSFFTKNVLPGVSLQSKWLLSFLLTVPFVNYLSTQSARGVLGLDQYGLAWQSITMINGLCLLTALAIMLTHARRQTNGALGTGD